MPPPQQPIVTLPIPIKGVVRSIAREEPEPQSLIQAMNVRPYGALDGFRRITQRPGVQEFTNLSTSTAVQGLLPIGYIVQPGTLVQGADFGSPIVSTFFGLTGSPPYPIGSYGPISFNIAPNQPIYLAFVLGADHDSAEEHGSYEVEINVYDDTGSNLLFSCGAGAAYFTVGGTYIESGLPWAPLAPVSLPSGNNTGVSGKVTCIITPSQDNEYLGYALTFANNGTLSSTYKGIVPNHVLNVGNNGIKLTYEVTVNTGDTSDLTALIS